MRRCVMAHKEKKRMKKLMTIVMALVGIVALAAPVRSLVSARTSICTSSPSGQPYDCEIEYIENTGGSYIDLGIKPNNTTELRVDFKPMAKEADYGYPVLGVDYSAFNISCYYGYLVYIYVKGKSICSFSGGDRTRRVLEIKDGIASVGSNAQEYSPPEFQCTRSCLLFATRKPDGTLYKAAKYRIFSCSIANLDLIPVRKGTVGYMYDRNSGRMFGNIGTGAFVLGPDKE